MLRTGDDVLAGCPRGQETCSQGFQDQLIPLRDAKALAIETRCTKGPCNASRHPDAASDHMQARAQLRSASVLINDPTPPTLSNGGGSALTTAWIGPKRVVTFNADDPSGITAIRAMLDGAVATQLRRPCGQYVYRCRQWPDAALDVDVSRLSDGPHGLTIAATDRAGNTGTADAAINVDNTPPSPPVNLASNLARGWTATPTVQLAWTNPAQQFAPIAGATVQACPAGQTGGCTTRDYDGAELSALSYDVPGEGAWDVRVWLRDAAGNSTPAQASAAVRLGLDTRAPTDVAFRPLDPANPSVVHPSSAVDGHSQLILGAVLAV